ncbi:MAG: hypothetical protein WKF48_04615 [Solirubrobacteraceae bacterium]
MATYASSRTSPGDQLLVIHTNTSGEIRKDDLDLARRAALRPLSAANRILPERRSAAACGE